MLRDVSFGGCHADRPPAFAAADRRGQPHVQDAAILGQPPRFKGGHGFVAIQERDVGKCFFSFVIRNDVAAGHQVGQVAVGLVQLFHFVLELVVDRTQLFIQRLQFFLRGFQFFVGRLEFLVHRHDFFVRRFQLLVRTLIFLDGALQVFARGLEFVFEVLEKIGFFVCCRVG